MTETTETISPATTEEKPAATVPKTRKSEENQQQPERANQLTIDDSNALCLYANFCRVTGTPEELIVDFALNADSLGAPSGPLVIKQRIVLNLYTAKRLTAALQTSIQRHEAAFGVLETNVQKRVQPAAILQQAVGK